MKSIKNSHRSKLAVVALLIIVALLSAFSANPEPVRAISVTDYFTMSYQVTLSQSEVKEGQAFSATATGSAYCKAKLPVGISSASVNSRVVAKNQTTGTTIVLNPSYSVTIAPFPNEVGKTVEITQEIPLVFPDGSPYGNYVISGELVKATVQAIIAIDVTGFMPQSQAIGNVKYTAANPTGGTVLPPPAPLPLPPLPVPSPTSSPTPLPSITPEATPSPTPKETISTPLQKIILLLAEQTGENGVLNSDVATSTSDYSCMLTIETGTKILAQDGSPLKELSAELLTPSAILDQKGVEIFAAYDFGPDGATFDPPATLTFFYKGLINAEFPVEKLRIAVLDPVTNQPDIRESTVNESEGTISTEADHFTSFALISASDPSPFSLTNLVVSPDAISSGQMATITVMVHNTGVTKDAFDLKLEIDSQLVDEKTVTLGSGESQEASFIVKALTGNHTVKVNSLEEHFTVTPLAPHISDLSLSLNTINPGNETVVSAVVVNSGDSQETYQISLEMDGVISETKSVTLAANSQENISFKVTSDQAGAHTLKMGNATATLDVKPEEPSVPDSPVPSPSLIELYWWLPVVIIFAGVTAYLIIRSKMIKTRVQK